MGGRLWTIQLLVQTLCLTSVDAFSNGKVTEACGSMMPKHGHAPNTTHSPYTLAVNVTEFSSGDYIQGNDNSLLIQEEYIQKFSDDGTRKLLKLLTPM